MSRSARIGTYLVAGGIGLAVVAVAVAAVVDLGSGPTTTRYLVGGLHRRLLLVAVPIAILVEAVIVYTVWRFSGNEDPKPTPENRTLELAWTVATGLVLLFVGVASYQVMAHPDVTTAGGDAPEDALEVEMTAHQWHWDVEYPEQGVTLEAAERVVLPADRPIRIGIEAADVIHSFHAPRLGLKQDAIPGQHNVLATEITEPGEYRLYCAEYCGRGHAEMRATIEVVPPGEFTDRLDERANESSSGGPGPED